ncbi:TolC family protein [Myroides sp. LJL115]
MKLKYIKLLVCISVFLLSPLGRAQQIEQVVTTPITYQEFLQRVFSDNFSLAAQRFEVDIANAQVVASKIMPDPELSFAWFDNQQKRLDMGYGFEAEVSWDLELGGKRKARNQLALNQLELTQLELREFFENLRAQSTISYFQALQNMEIVAIQKSSYESILQVSQSDSIRYSLGQISQVSAIQSKLEASNMLHDLEDALDELNTSLLDLNTLVSNTNTNELFSPLGDFNHFERLFSLEELLQTAQYNRVDLMVAEQSISVADKEIILAKKEKVIDLGLTLGVETNSYAQNIIAPTPSHTVVKAGVSVPLKFSNKRESGVKSAQYSHEMALLEYKNLLIQANTEIQGAFKNYLTKQKQIYRYQSGMLVEAKQVFEGIRYSYLRGSSSLLEVLEAQRTYNDTQVSYANTLLEYAISLVELERAAGIWDIEFK